MSSFLAVMHNVLVVFLALFFFFFYKKAKVKAI